MFYHFWTVSVTINITDGYSLARNLAVTPDVQLSFAANSAVIGRSCRHVHHIIRSRRPFLTQKATQGLVQAVVPKVCSVTVLEVDRGKC